MDRGANERPPMVSKKPSGLSRRIQTGLARLGLITIVAGGGAGAIHHVTGVDVTGPVGLGAAADNLASDAVGNFVNSSDSEPQLAQENLDRKKAAVEALFRPIGFKEGGQIEIDVAKLPEEAMTQDAMLAKRVGTAYEEIGVNEIKTVGNVPVEPGSRIAVDSPTIYVASEGPDIYFQTTIKTDTGLLTVLIPGNSVTVTKPGIFKPISAATGTTPLDVARLLFPPNK